MQAQASRFPRSADTCDRQYSGRRFLPANDGGCPCEQSVLCAPETKPQVEALRVIMAAGAAMDGQRGSLCTDTPRWKGEQVGCRYWPPSGLCAQRLCCGACVRLAPICT